MHFRAALTAFASVLALASTTTAYDLAISVTGIKAAPAGTFPVRATLVNKSLKPIILLNDPNSILTPTIKTSKFTVVKPNSPIQPTFTGIAVRWSPDIALANGDVTVIGAGEKVVADFNLVNTYDFSKSGSGVYKVTPNSYFYAVNSTTTYEFVTATASSDLVQFNL